MNGYGEHLVLSGLLFAVGGDRPSLPERYAMYLAGIVFGALGLIEFVAWAIGVDIGQ